MVKKKRRSRVRKADTKNWGQRGVSVKLAATISIPSGRCPVIAEDLDEESILEWIAELTDCKDAALTYKRSVYTYWIRHSFDVNSSDYRQAVEIINEHVPQKVRTVSDLKFDASKYLS